MQKTTGSQNFGPSCYDYDFDFDFDLRLNTLDYFLLVFYALFVFPVELIRDLLIKPFQHSLKKNKKRGKGVKYHPEFQLELPVGQCCPWPRNSHK